MNVKDARRDLHSDLEHALRGRKGITVGKTPRRFGKSRRHQAFVDVGVIRPLIVDTDGGPEPMLEAELVIGVSLERGPARAHALLDELLDVVTDAPGARWWAIDTWLIERVTYNDGPVILEAEASVMGHPVGDD